MNPPSKITQVTVNAGQTYQTIDGFGVNINAKQWQPQLIPALELLLNDLGATLYRVDIFGKSNWIDPEGDLGLNALDPAWLETIYRGEIARRGWAMIRWLNKHGIEPYLTASGIVPSWMMGSDGKNLADYEHFSDMMVTLVDWAIQCERLKIRYFGPLNETDIGDPEGPSVSPNEFPKVLEVLDRKLTQKGLPILLVVPEQAHFGAEYMQQIPRQGPLAARIGVFGTHCYGDYTPAQFAEVRQAAAVFPHAHLWMSEYGNLDQTGEKEWWVAWMMASRLMDMLENGYQGALVWDAFDNYHDHDEHWTIYGLLRTGLRAYTPKKRYFSQKQFFRFVRPGFQRIEAVSDSPELRVLAFASPGHSKVVVTGLNTSLRPANLNLTFEGFPEGLTSGRLSYYRSSEGENCCHVGEFPARSGNWPFTGADLIIPAECVFTLVSK